MKRFLILITAMAFVQHFGCDAVIKGRMSKRTKAASGRIDKGIINFCEDTQDYLDGGLTFTYSVGFFVMPPCISLSLELKDMVYTATEAVVPVITLNTPTQTDIRVNKIGVTVEEVQTDGVTVHIVATGSP